MVTLCKQNGDWIVEAQHVSECNQLSESLSVTVTVSYPKNGGMCVESLRHHTFLILDQRYMCFIIKSYFR